jgi:hypothetical protein
LDLAFPLAAKSEKFTGIGAVEAVLHEDSRIGGGGESVPKKSNPFIL